MASQRAATGTIDGSFPRLLESGEYSDLEIHCNQVVYKVHKAIVCPQCEFFRLAVKSEHGFQEAKSGIITMHETDGAVVRDMVEYLYQGSYSSSRPCLGKKGPFPDIMHHVSMYGAAEMYQMAGLKRAALENLKRELFGRPFVSEDSLFGTVWPREITGDKFVKFIEAVYNTTVDHDKGLRKFIGRAVARDMDKFREGSGLSKALQKNPQFAEDLVSALHDQRVADKELLQDLVPNLHVKCAACKGVFYPKLTNILRVGDLKCDGCGQERDCLTWHLPKPESDDDE